MAGLKPNSERLRDLMATHDLRARDVARLILVQPSTVYVWLTAEKTGRNIPTRQLRLLEREISRGIQ